MVAKCVSVKFTVNPNMYLNTNENENENDHNLNGIVGANIVLINSLKPTNIIMGVWNQVNIQFSFNNTSPSVVLCVCRNNCAIVTNQEKKKNIERVC